MTEPGARGPLGQEEPGRIRHLDEPALHHLENADLVRRAEAVLHRAEHAVGVVLLALEIEHGVDQMLEHARPGQRAFLGDVAHQEGGDAAPLGERHQARAALADLGDAARRRLQLGQEHGLDRVHDQRARLHVVELRLHDRQVVLRPQQTRRSRCPAAPRASSPGPPTPRRSRRGPAGPPAPAPGPPARARCSCPTPGSPPISTSEPRTTPPPSTRSSSPMPVRTRSSALHRDLLQRAGPGGRRRSPTRRARAAGRSSTSGTSSPVARLQSGHVPGFGLANPHCWQR